MPMIQAAPAHTTTPAAADFAGVDDPHAVALVLLRPDGEHRRFDLGGEVTTIGRREDCDLRIPLGDVSRRHCTIHRQIPDGDLELRLQDLGSSNGTYVNGRRVQESPLLPGDVIQVGTLKFLVQVAGEPAEVGVIPARRKVADDGGRAGHAAPLNPTAQSDAADADPNSVLDPSSAAGPLEDLMSDD